MWVFGYGSLMWRPGFEFIERKIGRLRGYHRALCVYSHVHRGTPERPGLVLGLDRGGSCRGVAFRVAPQAADEVVAYLRQRELVTQVYLERILPIALEDGARVEALAYIVDPDHPQYAGRLAPSDQLALIRQGVGYSGHNDEYVSSTHDHLEELGFADPVLDWLVRRLRPS